MPFALPPERPVLVPSIERSQTVTSETPPLVSLPIDMPCPASKWLCAMVRFLTLVPPLMAMWSSPTLIWL